MSERRVFGREEIRGAQLKTDYVDIPEWGEGVCVKVRELNSEESILCKQLDGPKQNAVVAAMLMINEDGTPIYDPNNPDDVATLARKGANVIGRICMAGIRLSGKTEQEIQAVLKNS